MTLECGHAGTMSCIAPGSRFRAWYEFRDISKGLVRVISDQAQRGHGRVSVCDENVLLMSVSKVAATLRSYDKSLPRLQAERVALVETIGAALRSVQSQPCSGTAVWA